MRGVLVLALSTFVVYNEALNCDVTRINTDRFKKVVAECVKDNQTLNTLWSLSASISAEEDDTSHSSDEEVPVTRGLINNINTKNVRATKSSRSKRSKNTKRFNGASGSNNINSSTPKTTTTTEESTTVVEYQDNTDTMNTVGESEDVCVLQCIFEKLEITDSNGLPDHKKFADALLKTASGRELRDFLQESIDECFPQVEKEDSANPCDYSSKLVMCLGEKGKSNCEDWPVGNLPF